MTSKFLRHIACENCGSSDANSLYDDGHTHCFKCGHTEFEGEYDRRTLMRDAVAPSKKVEMKGIVNSIPDRGITQQTCEKYGVTQDAEKQYYPYADASGFTVAVKSRTVANKSFSTEQPAEAQYPWKGLNKLLYGLRRAELITVTAGSGLGKSQFLREILYHPLKTTQWNIGGLFLEESTRKTARSIMSLHANKLLHLPDTPVTEQELKEAFDATLGTNRVYLFDHFGSSDVDNIANRIRYMAKACDCRVIFLDHISIVVSGLDNGDERKAIDNMMTKLRTLVQELEVTLICVSHLRRPQGNAGHEDETL